MDCLGRNMNGPGEESWLQGGVLVSAAVAAMVGCVSSSPAWNAVLSTYVVCLLPVLLLIVPDWAYFMRAPGEWSDVVFVEPEMAATQIRKLASRRGEIDMHEAAHECRFWTGS